MSEEEFAALRDHLFALYEAGRHEEALELLDASEEAFPDKSSRFAYWRACFQGVLGSVEDAVATLQASIAEGTWWPEEWLRTDPDLEAIRGHPQFERLVADMLRVREEAAGRWPSRPNMILLRPFGSLPRGLIVAMHMYGQSAARIAPLWEPAAELGFAVALPQSTQLQADGEPCWDDEIASERDVGTVAEHAAAETASEATPLILAGASQGALRSITFAIRGRPATARGFVGIAPGAPDPDALGAAIERAIELGVRGWLVTGERDPGRGSTESLHKVLSDRGMAVGLDVVPELGHDYPPDLAARLPGILDFVVGDELEGWV